MDRPSRKLPTPSPRTLLVGRCYVQTATDRSFMPDLEEDRIHPNDSIYRLVPSMQGYRNNLTALSQAYNLYFVAYQGHIFAYTPRSIPKQTIPRHPDLQIYPRPSKEALSIGGCIDPVTPHTINHIITGYLGREEILVACYDDGDVVAYYVKEIADSASRTKRSSGKAHTNHQPRLFFHENVGHTAWGLAIHRKSRLIAVSTNRFEVTVFAFALTTCQKKSKSRREFCDCCQSNDNTRSNIPRRARNWRIVVALGAKASNIPNICFVDSEDGQAEKICAIDINGVIWIADIWKMFQPVVQIPPSKHLILQSEEFWPAPSRGWGVLALPEESFVPVSTLEEMLGLPEEALSIFQPGSGCSQPMVNVAECLAAIPDNPSPPPTLGARAGDAIAPNLLDDEQSDESEAEPEEPENESDETDEEDEEDGDDTGQGSEEEEEEQEQEQDTQEDFVAQGIPEIVAADHGSSAVLFPPPPAGLQFQQALHDLDEALGQLAYAVQEFQEAISSPDTPEPALAEAQNSKDQDIVMSIDEKRKNPDTMTLRQRSHNRLNTPPVRLDMAFFPHSGKIQAIPRPTTQLVEFLKRPIEFNDNKGPLVEDRLRSLTKRYHFVRTLEKDVELRSLREEYDTGLKEIGVLCPDAVTFSWFQERSIRPFFRATSRLSMVFHVPELSLVVVGSPTGRVLCVTPTKLRSPVASKTAGMWHHGLRVECVLPRLSEEQACRPVLRPLHGLAVGPVQDDDRLYGDRTSRATAPKRYRLMLHYRNHDILTYEITREEQTGRLCIF
ncbi:uncharacterized protein TRIVIDRAFT_61576 [Trichoderma virens Gv29-8]|uniref:Uncharacterized protein n=1 Tax=Hypocrea virens (strain Gv29-8 / FGSC 10586) TaxID=413071 RepID=G9MKS0_HYPVG|nr:uncharacterized protein TRIVIDRAFT_61576 [Trichoderma virens Gv29-8]EHK24816.1 hypothetical protein TRIVIDRAFT_61576 [Trichoderma virens Gv29-8]